MLHTCGACSPACTLAETNSRNIECPSPADLRSPRMRASCRRRPAPAGPTSPRFTLTPKPSSAGGVGGVMKGRFAAARAVCRAAAVASLQGLKSTLGRRVGRQAHQQWPVLSSATPLPPSCPADLPRPTCGCLPFAALAGALCTEGARATLTGLRRWRSARTRAAPDDDLVHTVHAVPRFL